MPIISNYTANSHEGDFTYTDTSTGVTVVGKLSTDANDNLITVNGACTKVIDAVTVSIGSFSVFFSTTTHAVQDNLMDAIDAAVNALYNELHPGS